MTKITFCDRCTIEIERINRDEWLDSFHEPEIVGSWDHSVLLKAFYLESSTESSIRKVQRFHLCKKCMKGYNKIINKLINKSDKEVGNFMKLANKDEGKSKDKKFTFFKKKK